MRSLRSDDQTWVRLAACLAAASTFASCKTAARRTAAGQPQVQPIARLRVRQIKSRGAAVVTIGGPTVTMSSNPITVENGLTGDPNWNWAKSCHHHEIEGYASRASAHAGQTVSVMVSASAPHSASWLLYRIGWYGGAGMRRIAHGPSYPVATQMACPMDMKTGLIRCQWTPSFSFTVSSDWPSGLYLIDLIRDDDFASWVPLVITDDRPSALLFQASVTTYQAYNPWGGTSLYVDGTGTLPWGHAVEVSFDRPYGEGNGSGEVLRYEAYMARFLERYGYDVSYTTNLDVAHGGPNLLRPHRAFLSVGHDEYWSKEERDALQEARDEGVNELYFGANAGYWQVRLSDDLGNGNTRLMTGWKESWEYDPDQGAEVTAQFRNPVIGRPENALVGVMYDTWSYLRFPFVVQDSNSFLFEGTGLGAGDQIPWLVGYEEDRTWDNGASPSGLHIAAHVPVVSVTGVPSVAESTSYRAASGAFIFAAGTIEWSLGLADGPVADPRVERMTANVLHEALGLPIPTELQSPKAPAVSVFGPYAGGVSTVATGLGGVTAIAALSDGSLAVADTTGNRILRIAPAPGRSVTVLAGDGTPGERGWDTPTPGADCRFNAPAGIVADASGDLFVADSGNGCIREILPDASSTVVTLAGICGTPGDVDGPGATARFNVPMGLALMPGAQTLLVADSQNNCVREADIRTGAVSTLAGSSNSDDSSLSSPTAVAPDAAGNVYVVNSGTFTLARIEEDGGKTEVKRLTGGREGVNDGPGDVAGMGPQQGLVWDGSALLVSDAANGRIRRVVPGDDPRDTQVMTYAGNGRRGLVDGDGASAEFGLPLGLAIGPDGSLYVADAGNQAVRCLRK